VRASLRSSPSGSPASSTAEPVHPLLPGPVGLWTAALDTLQVGPAREQVAALDEQGWDALWFGEAYGREAFTAAALYLGASRRMAVATGIASI
jgi:alkanesulfonate monooxygenase SsuD/methylene tetrahydromethanopterin reductase-like flavin-dependent oxidoreductase (luciferase family)